MRIFRAAPVQVTASQANELRCSARPMTRTISEHSRKMSEVHLIRDSVSSTGKSSLPSLLPVTLLPSPVPLQLSTGYASLQLSDKLLTLLEL